MRSITSVEITVEKKAPLNYKGRTDLASALWRLSSGFSVSTYIIFLLRCAP